MSGKFLLSASDKSFEFFLGNSPEMYLWWIDHHLCWVCKEDKLLWTGPPSIVMFSVPVTQRLTSWGARERKYHSERDLRLYSTNASAPGDGLDQSEASIGDHWPIRGRVWWQIICQLLSDSLVYLCQPKSGHTPRHIISLHTRPLNPSLAGHKS